MDVNYLVCRLCLLKGASKDFVDIFADGLELVMIIKDSLSFLSIAKGDCLPNTVCHVCVDTVKQWTKFKAHSWNSNRILLRKIQVSITKLETKENHNNSPSDNKCEFEAVTSLATDSNIVTNKHCGTNEKICGGTDIEKRTLPTNEYNCDNCVSTFSSLEEYLDHQFVHQHEEILFSCELCEQICTSREELLAHEREHKADVQQKCKVCGKVVKKSSMHIHVNQHKDKFKCELCGLRCTAPSVLAAHKLAVHSTQRPFCCSTCGKRFSRVRNLRIHSTTHSSDRNFPCTVKGCAYAARIKQSVRIHMQRRHPDVLHETAAVCTECGKLFKTSRHLGDHLRRVHSAVKKHGCNLCELKFVDKHLLTTHLRTHTGERPFQCKICDKGFTRADGLKNHMETHQRHTSYNCKSCGKDFLTKQGRNRHQCTSYATHVTFFYQSLQDFTRHCKFL